MCAQKWVCSCFFNFKKEKIHISILVVKWHSNGNISKQSFKKCSVHRALSLCWMQLLSHWFKCHLYLKKIGCVYFCQIYLLVKNLIIMYCAYFSSHERLVNGDHLWFLLKEKDTMSDNSFKYYVIYNSQISRWYKRCLWSLITKYCQNSTI